VTSRDSIHAELQSVIDAGGSPLEFVVLRFQAKANDPTSEYFLPLLLSGLQNPVIFPALTVDSWGFSLSGDAGTQAAQNICAATGPWDQNQIPSSKTAFPRIVFGKSDQQPTGFAQVQGLINARLGTPTISGPGQNVVSAGIQFGAWTPSQVPAKLQPGFAPGGDALGLSGTFAIKQSCCLSEDLTTCEAGTTADQIGWGTFNFTMGPKTGGGAPNVTGSAVSTISVVSMQPPQVGLKVSQIALVVADLDQMKATVDVTSIPIDKHRDKWNTQAEKALNQPATKQNIIDNINGVLGGASNLTAIQNLLEQQMNAYLKSLFG